MKTQPRPTSLTFKGNAERCNIFSDDNKIVATTRKNKTFNLDADEMAERICVLWNADEARRILDL